MVGGGIGKNRKIDKAAIYLRRVHFVVGFYGRISHRCFSVDLRVRVIGVFERLSGSQGCVCGFYRQILYKKSMNI